MVIVVFGSTGGIGHAVALHFEVLGHEIGRISTCELATETSNIISRRGDVSDARVTRAFLDRVEEKFGPIDAAVFAVGSVSANLRASYQDNVITLYAVLEELVVRKKPPHVFVIGSLRSRTPGRNVAYCASKAAVEMVVQCERKVHPNTAITLIRPGFVDTPLYKEDSMLPYNSDGTQYPVVHPSDIAELIHSLIQIKRDSPGAKFEDVTVGEVLGDRRDLEWKER